MDEAKKSETFSVEDAWRLSQESLDLDKLHDELATIYTNILNLAKEGKVEFNYHRGTDLSPVMHTEISNRLKVAGYRLKYFPQVDLLEINWDLKDSVKSSEAKPNAD